MNAQPLVIQGTDKIVAYACGRCGLVARDADAAERCCPNSVCRYCGMPTHPWHSVCGDCRGLIHLRTAKRVTTDEYRVAMVCVDDDRYISTEDVDSAIEDGEITMPFVWGCDYTPLRLDADDMMESELTEHHEDAEFDYIGELEDFLESWNAKQRDGSYYVDHKTVVVLDAERLDALMLQFEFRAAVLA